MGDVVFEQLMTNLLYARRSADGHSRIDVLATACAEVLHVEDIAVQLRSGQEPTSAIGASSDRARAAEEGQLVLGEGPAIDAAKLECPIVADDLRVDTRWLGAAPALVELGVTSARAFPLQIGAIRLGSMSHYAPKAQVISDQEYDIGVDLARAATQAVLFMEVRDDDSWADYDVGAGITGDFDNRAVVHQACGMIAVQLDCDLADALVRLQAAAFVDTVGVEVIADQVVTRARRFEK